MVSCNMKPSQPSHNRKKTEIKMAKMVKKKKTLINPHSSKRNPNPTKSRSPNEKPQL